MLVKLFDQLVDKVINDEIWKIRVIPRDYLKTLCRVVHDNNLDIKQTFTDPFLLALFESGLAEYKTMIVDIFSRKSHSIVQFIRALQLGFSMKKDLAETIAHPPRHLAQPQMVEYLAD